MPAKAKPKRRLASAYDRRVAGMIASGLRNRIGAEETAEPGAVVWSMDTVIEFLEHFARHGTFNPEAAPHKRAGRSRRIRTFYETLREHGHSYESSVAWLAEICGCSESTVKKTLSVKTVDRS